MSRAWILLAATLLAAFGALAKDDKRPPKNAKEDVEKIGERDVAKGVNLYSIEKEIALGRGLANEVERNSKIVQDPVISEYVNRLGQNIVRNSDAKVPFTIKVIDNDEINAFALPGGFFYVHTGLIRLAESDAELAGVMAHEIAHVNARHGTRQASRAQITNWLRIPLIFVGGGVGYAVSQAAGLAIPLTFLKFSRGFEAEADLLGVQYLYKSGYDPAAMVTFFERIQAQKKKKESGGLAAAFGSHPPTGDRIKKVQKAINELLPERPQYAVSTSEFAEVKAQLARQYGPTKEKSDPNKPQLRRQPSGGTVPTEDNGGSGKEKEEEPPKLKRR